MTKARVNADNASADIQGVTAGTGLTGGGTSGTVTLTNDMATTIAAKGDLVAGTANDAYAALTVGANNTVLTADSSTATGLKWAAVPSTADSFSLINAGGTALTGSTTITISGFSGYNTLCFLISGGSSASSGSELRIRLNGDTTTKYSTYRGQAAGSNTWNIDNVGTGSDVDKTSFEFIAKMSGSASSIINGGGFISGCNSSGVKMLTSSTGSASYSTDFSYYISTTGVYTGTSAVTSFSLLSSTGNFDAGTLYLYGA